jgi:hypothetical protein
MPSSMVTSFFTIHQGRGARRTRLAVAPEPSAPRGWRCPPRRNTGRTRRGPVIGLLPVGPDAAEGLYRLVDAAYEKRSVAVSSNLHPSAFDELMPKALATATVDRLMHHAHLCQTAGDSIRLSQALAGSRS